MSHRLSNESQPSHRRGRHPVVSESAILRSTSGASGRRSTRRSRTIAFAVFIASAALAVLATSGASAPRAESQHWNPQIAAAYLDQRQLWWESWPKAARDHGTACISCHTAVPYALARPQLRTVLHDPAATSAEQKLDQDVVTRVRAWSTIQPFYGNWTPKGRATAIESRGTEAVLNALVLASRDHLNSARSADAQLAFANMFALQQTTGDAAGAWPWLNFSLRPWESATSVYFGAALAAVAVGLEPQRYAETPEIQPKLHLLRSYLRSEVDQPWWKRLLRRDNPGLFNRAMLLWASSDLPGLLSKDEQRSIEADLFAAQDSDGGWRLSALGRWSNDVAASADSGGDGYATGLITYALEQAGLPPNEPHVSRALAWLARHQDATTGQWLAWSLNKQRNPTTNVGKFMSDAATAYAVLALTAAER